MAAAKKKSKHMTIRVRSRRMRFRISPEEETFQAWEEFFSRAYYALLDNGEVDGGIVARAVVLADAASIAVAKRRPKDD